MKTYQVHHGDCRDVMREMPDDSVDAIVCDPPYGLSFMGKGWDHGVPGVEFWTEALRVAKPGAHLLAFGGTRTYHRLACAIEDAGWEIRDCVMWVYGSGFPKSLDVSKAIDKAAGAERTEIVGTKLGRSGMAKNGTNQSFDSSLNTYGNGGVLSTDITAPATDAARQWSGWGTALKPAWEPVIVARKPLVGTVAANVMAHGCGGINVDGCRVGTEAVTINTWDDGAKPFGGGAGHEYTGRTVQGRWPANLIHDGSDEVVGLFPNDAARFFYCAKASKADRDEGMEGFEVKRTGGMQATADGSMLTGSGNERTTARANHHPTVKPTDLMRYLCRLVTPPGGIVLDPFMGSGSTGKAAVLEGFRFIGIEREAEYIEIAEARIKASIPAQASLFVDQATETIE